jgi:hypothetical protein
MISLTVKTLSGELIVAPISSHSKWPTQDLKYAIQQLQPDFPHYYQRICHIDPATNEPYTKPVDYTQDSILCLMMDTPDVYIKQQEQFLYNCPVDNQPLESNRYSVHVYTTNEHCHHYECDFYSFLHNRHGFYLFGREETRSRKPWNTYIFGKSLSYSATLLEAMEDIPLPIREEINRKWDARDIIPYSQYLPYHVDYSDDEYDYD